MWGIFFSIVSILLAIGALTISLLNYLTRTRPYVSVKSVEVSPPISDMDGALLENQTVTVTIENAGELAAAAVSISLRDAGGAVDIRQQPVGVIFPRQQVAMTIEAPLGFTYAPDKEKSERYTRVDEEGYESIGIHPVDPEGYDRTLLTTNINYQQPPVFGIKVSLPYQTTQYFRVSSSGPAEPSIVEMATMT